MRDDLTSPPASRAPSPSASLVAYLARLDAPKLVLYCYLLWWLYTVQRYFDPDPRLWLSSLGLSAVIGTGLYLSTAHAGSRRVQLERWQVVRLYLMPFCVSSFSALIKDRGFWLVLHPTLADNLRALACCALFVITARVARHVSRRAELAG